MVDFDETFSVIFYCVFLLGAYVYSEVAKRNVKTTLRGSSVQTSVVITMALTYIIDERYHKFQTIADSLLLFLTIWVAIIVSIYISVGLSDAYKKEIASSEYQKATRNEQTKDS